MNRMPRVFLMTPTTDPELARLSAQQLLQLHDAARQTTQCFEHAALAARSEDVRALLRRRSEECRACAADLMAHARRLGSRPQDFHPTENAPTEAVRQRGFAVPTELALLQHCEETEHRLLTAFEQALEQPLEPAARAALEMLRPELRRQHSLLAAMRERIARLG